MNEALLLETERFLHDRIPLAAAMGVRLESYDPTGLTLTAPLEANHNHLGTAFGGSIAAAATLAGYALLWLELDDRDSHIVIRSSRISYKRPVEGELRAVCVHPGASAISRFKARFAKAGKASLPLKVLMGPPDQPHVGFEGVYVAIR
ncbi:MAG: YiiD C-terminal domain-containing protein [Luteolibacter sp.]